MFYNICNNRITALHSLGSTVTVSNKLIIIDVVQTIYLLQLILFYDECLGFNPLMKIKVQITVGLEQFQIDLKFNLIKILLYTSSPMHVCFLSYLFMVLSCTKQDSEDFNLKFVLGSSYFTNPLLMRDVRGVLQSNHQWNILCGCTMSSGETCLSNVIETLSSNKGCVAQWQTARFTSRGSNRDKI